MLTFKVRDGELGIYDERKASEDSESTNAAFEGVCVWWWRWWREARFVKHSPKTGGQVETEYRQQARAGNCVGAVRALDGLPWAPPLIYPSVFTVLLDRPYPPLHLVPAISLGTVPFGTILAMAHHQQGRKAHLPSSCLSLLTNLDQ